MELTQIIEQVVSEHIERSLREADDPVERAKWANGQRAKEQSESIVSAIMLDIKHRLDARSSEHEGK